MKIKSIIIFSVAFVALSQCKKEAGAPYSNESIVVDNAQAALYFHAIFCEAEYVWAFIDSMKYVSGEYADQENTSTVYKTITYFRDTKTATVDYRAWLSNHLRLTGTISVVFDTVSYRINGKTASIYLSDFSINAQDVIAKESTIKYRNGVNDQYACTLSEGAIREKDGNMPVLITCNITDGQYERIEGGETFGQEDDVWTYYGTMKGMIRDDPKLNYTNTVLATSTYVDNYGEIQDGKINYTMTCETAGHGLSQITIPQREIITFAYFCSVIYFVSVKDVH